VEQPDLVHQLGGALGLHRRSTAASSHAVAAHRHDVSDLPVANAFEQLLASPAMPDHQTHADLQVLALGLFAQCDHAPRGGAVHRDRLFHEHVQAPVDGVAEMHPAERRRCRQNGHVAWLQAVHSLAEGVEADELPVRWHVHLGSKTAAQVPVAVAQLLREDVGHGHQLDGPVLDAQRVFGGARAASAASHQRKLNRILFRRVYVRQSYSGQRRTQERAARSAVFHLLTIIHFTSARGQALSAFIRAHQRPISRGRHRPILLKAIIGR
jgi:hypothetical protein